MHRPLSRPKIFHCILRIKIRRKALILTQDSAQNDRIDHRIKGFSLSDFEDDRPHLRSNFSLFFSPNLTFKHFLDVIIDLEAKKSKIFND